MLALLEAHHILHVSRIRVNMVSSQLQYIKTEVNEDAIVFSVEIT